MSLIKFKVHSFDTDGSTEDHGSFDSREEAIKKIKEVVEEIIRDTFSVKISDFADWHRLNDDSFTWGVDNYTYYLKIKEE